MNHDRHGTRRARTGRVIATASMVLMFVACGTGTPSAGMPSAPFQTGGPSASPSGSRNSGPAATPTASTLLGRLPLGRVVVDRLVGSPEGDFVGAFVLDVDGIETAVTLPVSSLFFAAIWSPDGSRLLVNAFTGTRGLVGVLDPVAEAFTEIQPQGMAGQVECTDWTPDAREVICGRGGPDPKDDGIYRVDIATGAATRLTTSPFHHVVGTAGECGGGEGRAVYSADGSQFAYIQQKCGAGANPSADEEGAIVVAASDGSNQKVIVPLGGVRTHPGSEISWSPIGDLIAFGTQDGALSVIEADGTGLRAIDLPMRGFVYGPAWSPDGKWILVTVVAPGTDRSDLFVVAADGSSTEQLTNTPEVEAYTDWGLDP